ncbi:MAG: ATP dependent DNA ligase [Pseudomarimonas sp.]
MIDRAKLSFKGRYGIATSGAVTDPVLLSVAQDFDNQVMRKIEALAPSDLASRYAGRDPVLVSTKYDGESVFIYYEQGTEPFCFSASSGRVRIGLRALDALAERLQAEAVNKTLLRGELILPDTAEGERRLGVSEVIRASFSGSDEEIARLQLVLLDAVMLDGRDLRANQSNFTETQALLERLGGRDETAPVFAMAAEVVNEAEVPACFERIVQGGGEGIVVRRLGRAEARKVKPHRSVDAVLIGFVEDDFEGQYGVASLLTALVYPAETGQAPQLQIFARVGSGLSDAERVKLLDQLRPLAVPAPLAMTDSSGRAIHFIRPERVAELHGEDLVSSEGGREQRTQLLRWNADSATYEFLGLSTCPRLSFARFSKLRGDKNWQDGGARIAQVSSALRPTPLQSDRSAKLQRREVYAKGEMLRKLVVVEKADPELPFPYLIYWTDYSARRAEPLKVSLQVAATPERAHALAEKLLAEELSKGFVRVVG